jgi:hypothetical protein
VQPVGASVDDGSGFLGNAAEVAGKYGGGNLDHSGILL